MTVVPGGWRINGRKIWSSYAGDATYMVTPCRTSGEAGQSRAHGLLAEFQRARTRAAEGPGIA